MTKPARFLLRLIGLGRPRPKTRVQKTMRRVERGLVAVGLAYALLQVFPQVLFAHSVSGQGVTIHARGPISPAAIDRITEARNLLERSELAVPGRSERVFVCDSPWLFRLFAPTSGGAFAVSVPLTGNIFIASADIGANLARSQAPDHSTRSFSGVLAHEITHGLIRHRSGFWKSLILPNWVAEGYCDHVARGGSFPDAEGVRLFAVGKADPSPSFRYFVYRRMVDHLIDDKHLSFDQVVARAGDSEAVEADAREASRE